MSSWFRAHLPLLAIKANKFFTGLSTATRPSWCLNSSILRIIYRGAFEPMILYCVSVFNDTLYKKWAQKKLTQIQEA